MGIAQYVHKVMPGVWIPDEDRAFISCLLQGLDRAFLNDIMNSICDAE